VCLVYLMSATPDEHRKGAEAAAEQARQRFPGAYLIGVLMPGLILQPELTIDTIRGADASAASFVEAMQVCRDWLEERTKS
jgi:hypothetical protein